MSEPTPFDRFRIKIWRKNKAVEELRKHTVNGDPEWVMCLLAKTNYETIATFLDPSSWAGETTDHFMNVTAVVEHVLNKVPSDRLPANTDRAHVLASFRQAVLHRLPKVKL